MKTKFLCVFAFLGLFGFAKASNNNLSTSQKQSLSDESDDSSCSTGHVMRIRQCDGSYDRVSLGVSESPCEGVEGEHTVVVTTHYVECDG